MFINNSMLKEDFFKWLESREISDEARKTLSSKFTSATEYLNIAFILRHLSPSENWCYSFWLCSARCGRF